MDTMNSSMEGDRHATPAACTIISRNYLSHAKILAESFARHCPQGRFYLLVVDRLPENVQLDPHIQLVDPERIPGFYEMCFKYDVVEFCTAVKPAFLSLLLNDYGEEKMIYFDPDIMVMRPMTELYESLENAGIVLTPHLLTPIPDDGCHPNEQDILISGAYNLGFIALRRTAQTQNFLDWWDDHLRDDCRVNVPEGLFVDQKWIDLAPSLFSETAILRDETYNAAFWNLHERQIEKRGEEFLINGRPLAFYHFSGFNPTTPHILSKHQDRTQITPGTGLAELLDLYTELQMKHGYPISSKWSYGFARFDNGIEINPVLRQLYLGLDEETRRRFHNVFQVRGTDSFLEWATRPQMSVEGSPAKLSPFLQALYRLRYDAAATFPDVDGTDREAFIHWARHQASHEMGYEPQLVRTDASEPLVGNRLHGINGLNRLAAHTRGHTFASLKTANGEAANGETVNSEIIHGEMVNGGSPNGEGLNERQLRVLLVSHRFPPDEVAGVERYTEGLALELANLGHCVDVVTRRPGAEPGLPQILSEQLAPGAHVHRLTGGEVSRNHFLAHHTQLESLFEAMLIEEMPDVIHFNHVIDMSPHFIEIARRLGIPVVMTLHDFYFACHRVILQKPNGDLCRGPRGGRECAGSCFVDEGEEAALRWGIRTAYFRRLLNMADHIICPSEYVARYFRQYTDEATQISMIPNGLLIDPMTLAEDGVLAEDSEIEGEGYVTPRARGFLNLAYMGAIVPHKGIHILLEALAKAELDQAQLVLFGHVGDLHYADRLREQAARIPGLELRMYGGYEPAELPFLLYDVDCVVVPSTWPETFSLVTREAIVQGIPVLGARLGALTEVIRDGTNGFTFNPQQPDELAALLRRLVFEDDLLPQLRRGARNTEILRMADHTQAVADVYREVAASAAHGRRESRGVMDETVFLQEALLELGFGGEPVSSPQLVTA